VLLVVEQADVELLQKQCEYSLVAKVFRLDAAPLDVPPIRTYIPHVTLWLGLRGPAIPTIHNGFPAEANKCPTIPPKTLSHGILWTAAVIPTTKRWPTGQLGSLDLF
jgi:hypothetical protein